MARRTIAIILMILLLVAVSAQARPKQSTQAVPFTNYDLQFLRPNSSLAAVDSCQISAVDSLVWMINSWIIGDELYKVYLDPAQACPNPYPFSVSEVHIILVFSDTTTITYEGDIESVDMTNPACPFPGEIVEISPTYQDFVPDANAYDIWVAFDPPIVVNGPFFAGFYLGAGMNPTSQPALVTDDSPGSCLSYNIWDTTIGWYDLGDNPDYIFPGQLAMYVVGTTGGSGGGTEPAPNVVILSPYDNSTLFGSADLWAQDLSGSTIIDYMSFEYSLGGAFTEIGRDFDGTSPLRDGASAVTSGAGFSIDWNFSAVSEGNYTLRVTAMDTLGRSSSDSVTLYLEPTPPTPLIISPQPGSDFCNPLDLLMSVNDEDMSYIDIKRKAGSIGFSKGLRTVGVTSVDPYLVAGGAFALATYYWGDNGYPNLIKQGSTVLTPLQLAQNLAAAFSSPDNGGTYDEDIITGLGSYFAPIGNMLDFDYMRNPGYFDMRNWLEEQERSVAIGLSGNTGTWLALDGFPGWPEPGIDPLIRVSNPLNGLIEEIPIRNYFGINQVLLNGTWHNVDLMISLLPKAYTVSRTTVGADFDPTDGWSFNWTPFNLTEDSIYYFTATGHDGSGHSDAATVLLRYNCQGFYTAGDYDGDGSSDIADLVYLIDYITAAGPPPVGGPPRADANCDGFVNIADVVYYMNFTFGLAGTPCY